MSNRKLSQEEKDTIFELVQKDIAKYDRHKRIRMYTTVSAIACVVLLLIIIHSLFYKHRDDISTENQIAILHPETVPVNHEDIQLVLSNKKTITFKNDADIKYDEKGEIIVDTGNEQIKASEVTKEIVLNTLIVPKGRRSSLTLADGTKVWINSGSKLRFPSQFDAKKREIWVEGEVYIQVEKDTNRPFYVNTPRMIVDVLGTQFNVIAYKEDVEHSVVLVEGSVNVNVNNKKSRLLPNQKLSVSEDNVSVKKINVYDYISWKDGYLQFTNEPLSNILTRLSRYYDIPIDYEESVAIMECNGKLVLFDDVEEVLKTIHNTLPVKYSIGENRILVQKQ